MGRDSLLDPLAQRAGIQRTGHPVALLRPFHEDQGRNAADAEPFLEPGSQVGVDLDHLQLAGPLLRQLFERWCDDPARGTPRRPEIDQHRDGALLGHRAEVGGSGLGQPGKRPVALWAVGDAFGRRPDARLLTAVGAGDDLEGTHVYRYTSPIPRLLKL